MMADSREMTSFERMSTVLRMGIPDRVPVMLVSSTHGARELGLSLREYFSRPENVAEGQLRFTQRIGHDNLDVHYYAVREAEAFGAEVIFREAGPPNLGRPMLRTPADIDTLEGPDPAQSTALRPVLRTAELLAERARGRWAIVGHTMGPCSLPILLMGEAAWLELLLFGSPARRRRMMQITSRFCVAWANALMAAGCDAISMSEPLVSPTILTREQASRLTLPTIRRVVKAIQGPVILWSIGAIQSTADLVPDLGVRAVSSDPTDDLAEVKRAVAGRIAVLGGLNDLAMITSTPKETEASARRALEQAAPGGGFILSHQNEIPTPVGDEVLLAVVEAARRWGRYGDEEAVRAG